MANKNDYDILVIRDYYPSTNNPTRSTWVYNQVVGLQKLGFKPLVISPTPIIPFKNVFISKFRSYDTPLVMNDNYSNTTVIRPPYFKIPRNKLKGLTLRNLSKVILKHGDLPGIKLIHAHFGQNGVAALPLKEKLKVPLITSFYGYDSGRLGQLFKPYYKELISKGDLFLALSNDMKNDLLKLGFPEQKILVHHLGIDVSKFSSEDAQKASDFTVLTVARFSETKGIQYVLKALRLFLNNNFKEKNRIKYRIIGGGSYENKIKALVDEFDLKNIVTIINNLGVPNGREIVLHEMKKCDLFVLASSVSPSGGKEGTPVVLMEAQACGKPCISTFHAGIPEVVINNETGILVNEHSPMEISNAISKLYFDYEMRSNFSHNAREHVQRYFNQRNQMSALKHIYESVL